MRSEDSLSIAGVRAKLNFDDGTRNADLVLAGPGYKFRTRWESMTAGKPDGKGGVSRDWRERGNVDDLIEIDDPRFPEVSRDWGFQDDAYFGVIDGRDVHIYGLRRYLATMGVRNESR
jgi:hypothetical protein